MTTYLICPQSRSQQRKHIDVCHRCSQNNDCEAYLSLPQNPSKAENQHRPAITKTASRDIDLLNHVVRELKAIRTLLQPEALARHDSEANLFAGIPADFSIDLIRKTLQEIRSVY